jgi:hypothetical protein
MTKEVAAVIPEFLWIIGFYAAAAAWAHWMFGRKTEFDRLHYVLVAGNHQLQIEGYVRALQHFSRRTGTDIGITVLLSQSDDETGAIVEKFARSGVGLTRDGDGHTRDILGDLKCASGVKPSQGEQVVWVELTREDDVSRLPL